MNSRSDCAPGASENGVPVWGEEPGVYYALVVWGIVFLSS